MLPSSPGGVTDVDDEEAAGVRRGAPGSLRSDGLVSMSMHGKVNWRTGDVPVLVRGGAVRADGWLLATVELLEPGEKAIGRSVDTVTRWW